MNNKNPAYEKAYAFAIRVVNAYKYLTSQKREYVLSRQLLRSGTSIGANLAEANGAISEADLSAKVSIAYKESQETKYWLNLLKDTEYLDAISFESLFADVAEVAAILFAIDFQKNNFAALSVGDILQYNLLPAALRNEFSESLYHQENAN